MALIDLFSRKGKNTLPNARWLEIDQLGRFYHLFVNAYSNGFDFEKSNPYVIAKTLAEVYTPIDVIADRISGCNYYIANDKGERVEDLPTNLERLVHKPNPTTTLQSFIYNIIFSELSHGASYIYPLFSTKLKKTWDKINQIYLIEPDKIQPYFKRNLEGSQFLINEINEMIDYWKVYHFSNTKIDAEAINFNIDGNFDFANLCVESPLKAVKRNIENLMVVYSARYNVYANNGAGGIISRKQPKDGDMEQFYEDGEMRQKMIDEMNRTDGITGGKNFIGISSIPLDFTETLGKIKDLMPFEETKKDAETILGIYGVSPFLTPLSNNTTFTNQEQAELAIWQNKIIPSAKNMCKRLDNIYYLNDSGYHFEVDFSEVPILQTTRKDKIATDLQELELYRQLQDLGIDNQEILSKWKS